MWKSVKEPATRISGDALVSPRRTTAQFVAQYLREAITRGQLPPGTRLRQSEISAALGVSTTPVREAFGILQPLGLVRVDPRRGAVVASATPEEIQEAYEMRLALESLALVKGIERLSDDDIQEMERLLAEMDRAETQDDWLAANNRFHLCVYAASGRPNLCRLINTLRESSTIYLQIFLTFHGREEHTRNEHRAILEACRVRDVEAAIAALREHLRATEAAVLDVVRRQTARDTAS